MIDSAARELEVSLDAHAVLLIDAIWFIDPVYKDKRSRQSVQDSKDRRRSLSQQYRQPSAVGRILINADSDLRFLDRSLIEFDLYSVVNAATQLVSVTACVEQTHAGRPSRACPPPATGHGQTFQECNAKPYDHAANTYQLGFHDRGPIFVSGTVGGSAPRKAPPLLHELPANCARAREHAPRPSHFERRRSAALPEKEKLPEKINARKEKN